MDSRAHPPGQFPGTKLDSCACPLEQNRTRLPG
jgi:hypothetical protein